MRVAAAVNWGDVPTWVGSVGTVLAFAIALVLFALTLRDRQRDQAGRITAWVHGNPTILRSGERAYRQASMETVTEDWSDSEERVLIEISIRNTSDQIISDVRATLVTYPGRSKWGAAEMHWLDIGPGEELIRAMYRRTDVSASKARVRLVFTDTRGRHWTRLGGHLSRSRKPSAAVAGKDMTHNQVQRTGKLPLLICESHTAP